jgi:hypothetical protein
MMDGGLGRVLIPADAGKEGDSWRWSCKAVAPSAHIRPVGAENAAYYTTAPLRQTLAEPVDFDYINQGHALRPFTFSLQGPRILTFKCMTRLPILK